MTEIRVLLRKPEPLRKGHEMAWVTAIRLMSSSFFMRCDHAVDMPDTPAVLHGASYHRLLWKKFGIRIARVRYAVSADLLSRQACEQLDLAAPHVDMLWNAHEYDSNGTLQIVQRFELP